MNPKSSSSAITWINNAESTNNELRKRIDKTENLSILAAETQTAGRGQGDHKWHSEGSLNLTFSVVLKFDGDFLPCSEIGLISCVAALSVKDFLTANGVVARIKWPNDIWVGQKKICGLLIENTLDGKSVRSSIIGIGFNLNQIWWPQELPNPVSLKQLTGKDFDTRESLQAIEKEFRRRYEMLSTADGRIALQEEFEKNMFRLP